MLKIALLNTSDVLGGAARSAYRLHRGLLGLGQASRLLVQLKVGDDATVIGRESYAGKALGILRAEVDHALVRFFSNHPHANFDVQFFPDCIVRDLRRWDPAVVHLHWICGGFVRIESLARIRRPLVWTMHDMWPFTGGCHYAGNCLGFRERCGCCHLLGSQNEGDLSRWVWNRKRAAWRNLPLTLVAPSRWLASMAQSSSLFAEVPVEVIPYGLDLDRYRPLGRENARRVLGLPPGKKLILFGAMARAEGCRKGFGYFREAMARLRSVMGPEELEVVVMGGAEAAHRNDFGFRTNDLGFLHDDVSLALAYSAADVFVAPSVQDNLPNAVLEALACGVPCVAFAIGGMPDMINHRENGYLARPFDTADLAEGIRSILTAEGDGLRRYADKAREKAERDFDLLAQAKRYLELYRRLVD